MLDLPPQGRAALAQSLLESLDTEIDEDAEAQWREEIGRRMQPEPMASCRSQLSKTPAQAFSI
jgi:hypothetical protein